MAMKEQRYGIEIELTGLSRNANTLRNITNIMASKEDILVKTIDAIAKHILQLGSALLAEDHRCKAKNPRPIWDYLDHSIRICFIHLPSYIVYIVYAMYILRHFWIIVKRG